MADLFALNVENNKNMMNKLHELYVAANNLQPYEDKYNFILNITGKEDNKWYLRVEHEYINKTAHHPISTVYSKLFNELNEEIIKEIKEKLILRQLELIKLRESECSKKLEEYRRVNEECANRIVHLELIKKI